MDGLKQRIIGALVLVSLAVIFVPMVFDEPHSERTSTSIKIPEEPPFPEVNAPESDGAVAPVYEESTDAVAGPGQNDEAPEYRLVEEDSQPFANAPQSETAEEGPSDTVVDDGFAEAETPPVAKATAPAQEPQASRTNESMDGAWVVQLGSFGNADNARRLRDKVRDKGYGSQLQEVERADTTLTRVFSGPFTSKADAEAAKRVLDEAFSLNSLVTTGDK